MGAINCIVYLCIIGITSFVGGRFIPEKFFGWDRFPYKTYEFEKNGKLYDKIKIKSWQSKMIDLSKIFTGFMPKKAMTDGPDISHLKTMIHETCVAEFIHEILVIMAIPCIFIWWGPGGTIVFVVYAIANMPYILIQRYNRPRLKKVYRKMCNRENTEDSEK